MKRMRRALICFVVLFAGLWGVNTNVFVVIPPDQQSMLIAHRGVHQIYAGPDRTAQTCTANPIVPLAHTFIANTLASMEAAFSYGADVVEIDVHLTTDDRFAVFHDWTLDCQTDGRGVTHDHDMPSLQSLDLGYGYTSDGVTFPLRSTDRYEMPDLTEVYQADLQGQYLVNFKSNRAQEGDHLAQMLETQSYADQTFGVYGGDAPTQVAISKVDGLRGFGKTALKDCLIRYALYGWSSYVPAACRDRVIAVPMDYGPYLWGWPHVFTDRMKRAGTDVILWGPYDGTGFSSGIDDIETLAQVPKQFDGYIWTNRIEVIGPLVKPE